VLVLLALPALGVHFVGVDARTLPPSASARQVSEALDRDDVRGRYAPIIAVGERRPPDPVVARIASLPGVAAVVPAREAAPGLWRLDVVPSDRGLASTQQTSHELETCCPQPVSPARRRVHDQQASSRGTCRGRSGSRSPPPRSSSCSPAPCCRSSPP
jgi:hypothetical protein